jgi:hypothetical protein
VFFDMKPTIVSRPGARPVPRPIHEGFRFEDVGFRYPDSDRWAVRHVSSHSGPASGWRSSARMARARRR